MGFMDKLNELKGKMVNEYSKLANNTLMEGTMAACALIANANGVLKDEEMQMMMGHIGRNEQLKVYEISKCMDVFKKCMEGFTLNKIIGDNECFAKISKIKKPEEGRVLVAVCCAIAGADGDFDENEKAMVRKICDRLTIHPGEFDL